MTIKWADSLFSVSVWSVLQVMNEMAARASASAANSLTVVPDWIEKNSQLFRAHPADVHRSGRNIKPVKSVADDDDDDGGQEYSAACMAAMLVNTDYGTGWIEAPIGLQPPSYYRDLSNHPNILATFVYTARRKASFFTDAMGQQLSQQEWKDFINKFNAWLNELDAFWFYIMLIDQQVETASEAIGDSLSKFVLKTAYEIEEAAKKEVAERINKTFALASEYMLEKHMSSEKPTQVAVKAGFQHEAFGTLAASQTTIPITFTTTTLSKDSSNSSSTIQYSSTTINKFTFRLNSANIIANAEALARGTTLISTKAYCDYINGPLDQWAIKGGDI